MHPYDLLRCFERTAQTMEQMMECHRQYAFRHHEWPSLPHAKAPHLHIPQIRSAVLVRLAVWVSVCRTAARGALDTLNAVWVFYGGLRLSNHFMCTLRAQWTFKDHVHSQKFICMEEEETRPLSARLYTLKTTSTILRMSIRGLWMSTDVYQGSIIRLFLIRQKKLSWTFVMFIPLKNGI